MTVGLDLRMRIVMVTFMGLWPLGFMASALAQDFVRGHVPFVPSSVTAESKVELSIPGPNGREILVPLELTFSKSSSDAKKLRFSPFQNNPYNLTVFEDADATMKIVFSSEPAQTWRASDY
jgi:hypothetical protein